LNEPVPEIDISEVSLHIFKQMAL